MNKKIIILIFICVLWPGWMPVPAGGEPIDGKTVQGTLPVNPTATDLIAYSYEHNPTIQAARQEWLAAVENYRVSTAYPDPQVMVTYFPQPIETRLGPQDWNAVITQMIPFPGKLSKIGEIAAIDSETARLGLDGVIRDVAVDILESGHELAYIRKAKEIADKNRELLDHLRKLAETAHVEDRALLTDVLKAQAQSAQLMYDVLLLEELEQSEIARLNGLLNRLPDADVGTPVMPYIRVLDLKPEDLYALAEQYQEEIRIAGLRVEQARAKTNLARFQNLPDFKLGVFYASIGQPDVPMLPENAGDDAIGIQVGLNIPLWFGKNRSNVAKSGAMVKKAEAARTARINGSKTQIRNLYFRLENALRLQTLYQNRLIPQASKSIEVAETWFKAGEGSFSDFIETQATLYNFELALARSKADAGKFRVRLERLIGRSLDDITGDIIEGAKKLHGERGDS